AGRMVPRPALMEAVFGFDDEIQSNALDSHISRLRRKLAASLAQRIGASFVHDASRRR
ncbi:winged helix-turn-helix domain-containing protein, partial [Rhizobium ruizarguesonis]